MTTSDTLLEQYDNYYSDGSVEHKRVVTAVQSFGHIADMVKGRTFKRVIDIGAGQGSLLQEMSRRSFAEELHAVEISNSGLEAIHEKNISKLTKVGLFDGYHIDYPDEYFDFGCAVHVLEHVEHERRFIAEVARVCKEFYIEIPLEFGCIEKAIRVSGPHGHINFYTPVSFENLLKTTELNVDQVKVFPHDKDFEIFMAGKLKGTLKYYIRSGLLKIAPSFAPNKFVYMAGAICSSQTSESLSQRTPPN